MLAAIACSLRPSHSARARQLAAAPRSPRTLRRDNSQWPAASKFPLPVGSVPSKPPSKASYWTGRALSTCRINLALSSRSASAEANASEIYFWENSRRGSRKIGRPRAQTRRRLDEGCAKAGARPCTSTRSTTSTSGRAVQRLDLRTTARRGDQEHAELGGVDAGARMVQGGVTPDYPLIGLSRQLINI
jgi:hypothetical protein